MNKYKIIGRIAENIAIGLFVNGIYGISDGSIETFNIIDIIISIYIMTIGVLLQQKEK